MARPPGPRADRAGRAGWRADSRAAGEMPFDQFDRVGQQRVFLLVDAGLVQGRVDEPGAQLLPMLNVGDYSHFERFRMEIPEYMKPHIPPNPRRRGSNETNDLRKIITESFRFSSNRSPG